VPVVVPVVQYDGRPPKLAALPEIALFAELSEHELQGLAQRGIVKIFRTSPGGREVMLSIETAPASVAELPLKFNDTGSAPPGK
jgi:hypothetical protein